MAKFDSLEQIQNAVNELRELNDRPRAIEYVDENVLAELHRLNPNQLNEVIVPPFPLGVLLVEFDGSERIQKKSARRGQQILSRYAIEVSEAHEPEQQQNFWKVREATSMLIGHNEGLLRAVPLFDGAVPPVRLREYMEGLYHLLEVNAVRPAAVWGHVGDGLLHVQPMLNLGQVGDRQKVFRLLDEYNKLVLSLSGTISAETGDGRLRTPYLEAMYGPDLYSLFIKIKQIFDPYGTLNPGVKFDTTIDDIKELIRPEFTLDHIYDHLPRS